MKLFTNVLKEPALHYLLQEYEVKKSGNYWAVNEFFWNKKLLEGVEGITTSTHVSESTYPVVLADLEGKLPDTKNVVLQYYNWHKGAGISPHGDESYRFGATVYLNESWNPAWGGIFHWKDSFGEQKTFLPEFNSLVLNDEQEEHWVTNVSRKAPYCRKTLQIWGLFK